MPLDGCLVSCSARRVWFPGVLRGGLQPPAWQSVGVRGGPRLAVLWVTRQYRRSYHPGVLARVSRSLPLGPPRRPSLTIVALALGSIVAATLLVAGLESGTPVPDASAV